MRAVALGTTHPMSEQAPEPKEEEVDGREVFVARDESGVAAVSEDEEGADPRVATDDVGDDEGEGDDEE